MHFAFKFDLYKKIHLNKTNQLNITNISNKLSYLIIEYKTLYGELKKIGRKNKNILRLFVVCWRQGTRQRPFFAVCLPGHTTKADGRPCASQRHQLRRVPGNRRTAKTGLCRVPHLGTRQRHTSVTAADGRRACIARAETSPCVLGLAHGKGGRLPCVLLWNTAKIVFLPCARKKAHGKDFGTRDIRVFRQ